MKKDPTSFVFGRRNYQLLFLGLALLIIGYVVMTLDPEPYGFGFLGLTLGPLLVLAGFVVEFFAIMVKKK
ncbi:Protein of unknown function [Catalinimonas alkaloidigena]|uniref:DUF3098 domain-containing protein n=1 Tax=Catalinimonas alkaloidigena TaxID=1075417 RepID=A0A1G9A6H8_9BACT|nr:DUF3098 domain-containing protein [Catalinimonas alkaloidigena]SDK22897.1 Protein of unknown function [Catalinimonas alkaloidigena]